MKLNICLAFKFDTLLQNSFGKVLSKSDFLVLPEMFFGGYEIFKKDKSFFISEDSEIIDELKELSKKHNICIVAGSMPIGISWKDRKNTSLTINNGKIIHKYEKIHLFKPLKETVLFTPGSDFFNYRIKMKDKFIRCGTIICYDLRFPELARKKTLNGLDILFVPAWWPKERDEIWYTLLKARAIENQIFVIGVNSDDKACGNSYTFSPTGELIFSTDKMDSKSYYTFTVDLEEINRIKEFINCLKDVRIIF